MMKDEWSRAAKALPCFALGVLCQGDAQQAGHKTHLRQSNFYTAFLMMSSVSKHAGFRNFHT